MSEHKQDALRVALIVSNDPSDIFFASELLRSHSVVGILIEDMTPVADSSPLYRKLLRNLSNPIGMLRKLWEVTYGRLHARNAEYTDPHFAADFGDTDAHDMGGVPCRRLEFGDSPNDAGNVKWLQSLRPDILVTCGGSLLRKDVLSVPKQGALNLHGGLSQYYRGIRTTDWAILNGEPEKIGATVHFISAGIDDGDIVWQGRPEISHGDHPNRLYVKVVILGIQMMRAALDDLAQGTLRRAGLDSLGELYLKRDFTPATLRAVWRQYDRGLIDEYASSPHPGTGSDEIRLIHDFNLR